MQKIVINKCYGGFGLSQRAVMEYARLKGITLYADTSSSLVTHYYTVPLDEVKRCEQEGTESFNSVYFSDIDIERDDPFLVQVVEQLGEDANGEFARLKIVEIPDGVEWTIGEYDGIEHIAEVHRTWS